jgi:hypothetical protein
MAQLFAAFRRWNRTLAATSVVAFIVASITGLWPESLAFLAAGMWWALLARYWAGKATSAQRHGELRAKRLERERMGLAPPRG